MLSRQAVGLLRGINGVLVKIDQNVVIFRKINSLIAALNTDNVRARRVKSRDQPGR
jgi:hypothetical protein